MTRVKICGCRTPEQALTAADAGAGFIGMVFAESRRKVSRNEARSIVAALGGPSPHNFSPETYGEIRSDFWFGKNAEVFDEMLERSGRPLTVGVFANNPLEEVQEIVEECGIDIVQFSGKESWDYCRQMNVPTVKVVHVGPDDSAASVLARIEGASQGLLLDRADAKAFGGTGMTMDWWIAAQVQESVPIWLAGGLTPENVAEAIATVRPWAVDVSSGVETDGVKDFAKIRAFVQAAQESV